MTKRIGIVGAGIVGRSWAICFARSGCEVDLYDVQPGVVEGALDAIAAQLEDLDSLGLLRQSSSKEVLAALKPAATLDEAVGAADYVQENGPERIEVKRELTAALDAATPDGVPIASSTSALLPSRISDGLPGASRCLVAHPLNPPHLIPAVEIVPAPATAAETVARTAELMTRIGQSPVVAHRETEGFIMNRLQGAVLDEAIKLIAEGIAEPEDVDLAMSAGLSRRWSFMGPLETIDLNAPEGIAGFFDRYGEAYRTIGRDRPTRHDWTGPLAERLVAARRDALPECELAARKGWRDRKLAELAAFFNEEKNGGTYV
ncbi:3-hydroxyacyl-CoA dehydrogenase [Aliiruegeria haliotis]|uniref:3-hydroxyacyl-CoA dehydrogenase n=1 Tax=Aliiruegeria haliotis TaxID=1280846 RepID=A0A2T0RLY7_9RHOB|nr:3-hydroxyacyl-CoA dehydrogenase [Aliiruegeria haliotis]PRY22204.1 3-hydroxyacyl-CoA dehydrogenase [Aliiruegeria haliotis]